MTNSKRRMLPAVVAGALGMAACAAWAETTTYTDVLSDAKTQSLAALPAMSGQGFTIGQGDFTLTLMPGMQFRDVVNYGDERKNGESDAQQGFEITRARFALAGTAYKDLKFFFQWDAGDITGGVTLLDAYAVYQYSDQLAIKSGQFKAPGSSHEGLIDWSNQVAVDRSMANELLNAQTGINGRVQGISVIYGSPNDAFRIEGSFNDGFGSGNTSFQNNASYFGVDGRIEWILMGKPANAWQAYSTMTGIDASETILVLGGGVNFTQGDLGAGAGGFNALSFSIDGQYEMQNLSVYAALLGNWFDPRNSPNPDDDSTFNWGVVLQGAYAFSKQWEVFARFDGAKFDNEQANGEDTFYEIGAGVNYYLFPDKTLNGAKFTIDLAWLPNSSPADLPYQNILAGSDETEIVLRAQLQIKP